MPNIILVVGGAEANIVVAGLRLEVVVLDEVAEFDAAPPGDLAPALYAFEFVDDFGFGQLAELVDPDMEVRAVVAGYLQGPFAEVEAVGAEADVGIVADIAGGGRFGVTWARGDCRRGYV